MRVAELRLLLERMDDKAVVEFYDCTTGRECPINTHTVRPCRMHDPIQEDRVVLSNRLS